MRQFARPFPIDRLSLEARVLYTAFLVFLIAGILSSVWLYRDSFGDLSSAGAQTYYLGNEAGAAAERGGEGAGQVDGGPALDLPDDGSGAVANRFETARGIGGPALDLPDDGSGANANRAETERGNGGPALDLPESDQLAADPALDLVMGASSGGGGLRLEKSSRQVMETFHFHLFTVPVVLLIVGHIFMLTALSLWTKIVVISAASIATFVHLLAPLLLRFGGAAWAPLMPISVVVASLGWLPMTVWPLWEMWTRLPQRVDRKEGGA